MLRPGTKVLGRPLSCNSKLTGISSSQGRDGQLAQHGHVHHLVSGDAEPTGQTARRLDLFPMALAVIEGDGVHLVITGQGLDQAGCAVLTTTEYHDGFFTNYSPLGSSTAPALGKIVPLPVQMGKGSSAGRSDQAPSPHCDNRW